MRSGRVTGVLRAAVRICRACVCPCRKAASKRAAYQHVQHGRQAAAAAAPVAKGLPLSWLDIFVLSALAKIGATLVTYPLLVVKNRLQVGRAGPVRRKEPTDEAAAQVAPGLAAAGTC